MIFLRVSVKTWLSSYYIPFSCCVHMMKVWIDRKKNEFTWEKNQRTSFNSRFEFQTVFLFSTLYVWTYRVLRQHNLTKAGLLVSSAVFICTKFHHDQLFGRMVSHLSNQRLHLIPVQRSKIIHTFIIIITLW